MRGHKICFYEEKGTVILKLSLLPLFIWSTGLHIRGCGGEEENGGWGLLSEKKHMDLLLSNFFFNPFRPYTSNQFWGYMQTV